MCLELKSYVYLSSNVDGSMCYELKFYAGTLSSKVEGLQGELVCNEILRISFACFILKRAQAQNFKSTESEET